MTPPGRPATLDIVIPVYDEESCLEALFERLDSALPAPRLAAVGICRVRYIFVDDGSQDRSAEIIARHIRDGAPAVLCRLSRNFGHQAAVVAGLDRADADLVGIMDADLQDPPEEFLAMIAKWREGHQVVFGVRTKRKEHVLKRAAYAVFYRLLTYLSEGMIPADSGDFGVMDRVVVAALRRLPERQRFVRGLRAWVGFRQVGHVYERAARASGRPKYSLGALYQLATDGLASSSVRPLRVAQLLAVIFFLVSAVVSVFAIVSVATVRGADRSYTLAHLHLVLTSATGFAILFCLYILSSYVGRAYLEVKGRPTYVLLETVEAPESQQPGRGS